MSERKPVGQLLDSLGITATLREGELVADALVIMRIVEADGDTRMSLAWPDTLNWIVRRGMLEVARDLERCDPCQATNTDDEDDVTPGV